MRSSDRRRIFAFVAALAAAILFAPCASAQQPAQGFAVERFYPSSPGGGWFVMDALDMHGQLGGVMGVTTGYSAQPLRVTDGAQRSSPVSDRAFVDFGFAVTHDRFRLSLNLDAPLVTKGASGTVGGYQLTGPSLDLGSNPDTLSDARIGFDARLLGDARSAFRLGAGAQLFVPNGNRSEYDTDGTYRAMGRVMFAGDVGMFTYAGHVGAHVRPLDDSPAPGSPRGSELLFGVAGGVKERLFGRTAALIVGPEIYGATAFRSFFEGEATSLEALLSGRYEETVGHGAQLRVKLGGGAGLNQRFGAPEWRVLFGLEVFAHDISAPAEPPP